MSGRMGAFIESGRGTAGDESVDMSDSMVWTVTRGRAAAAVEDILGEKGGEAEEGNGRIRISSYHSKESSENLRE